MICHCPGDSSRGCERTLRSNLFINREIACLKGTLRGRRDSTASQ